MLPRVLLLAAVVGVGAGEDRWVWGRSVDARTPRIPGYVEPHTTPAPPVTTFRPRQPVAQPSSRPFKSITAHPYFLGSYPPFLLLGPQAVPARRDGTTKSRVPDDTALGDDEGVALDARDKYTTLDRLQRERGPAPPLPRPSASQLGGLHPDEVFYADDDLLIIRGGGFNAPALQDPPNALDDAVDTFKVAHVDPVPPSPHEEYNGNVPAFLPPPRPAASAPRPAHPLSLYVTAPSSPNSIFVPYVFPVNAMTTRDTTRHHGPASHGPANPAKGYVYAPPPVPFRLPPAVDAGLVSNHVGAVQPGHSLRGDTDVNFRSPRPAANPHAELFTPPRHAPRRARPRL